MLHHISFTLSQYYSYLLAIKKKLWFVSFCSLRFEIVERVRATINYILLYHNIIIVFLQKKIKIK